MLGCEVCGRTEELNSVEGTEFKKVCLDCYFYIKESGVRKLSELKDFVRRNSKTFTLKDGESAEVVYKGYKIGANKYDPEKESVYYSFETDFGIKIFQSGALGLANIFDAIKKDAKIKITRHGEGNKTKYAIEEFINNEWVSVGKPPAELEEEEV